MARLQSRAEIAYVTWDSSDHTWIWWYINCQGVSSRQDPHSRWPANLLVVRWLHNVNSLCPNLVRVDGISRCGYQGHAVLRRTIVLERCLRSGALLPSSNPLDAVVTSFCDMMVRTRITAVVAPHHSHRNRLTSWLQKAVSLSAKISSSAPRS